MGDEHLFDSLTEALDKADELSRDGRYFKIVVHSRDPVTTFRVVESDGSEVLGLQKAPSQEQMRRRTPTTSGPPLKVSAVTPRVDGRGLQFLRGGVVRRDYPAGGVCPYCGGEVES